jgi:hypothetical protein
LDFALLFHNAIIASLQRFVKSKKTRRYTAIR